MNKVNKEIVNKNKISKLISQGSFGCVYYPNIKCNKKEKINQHTKKKNISKLQQKDFYALNEIHIGNKIKGIANFKNYFSPVINSCPVNLTTINPSILENCEVLKHSVTDNFLILDIEFINNTAFSSFLLGKKSEEIIFFLTNSLLHLLEGINLLIKKDIIHMDLKDDNILFDIDKNKPIIIDFGISIDRTTITKNMNKNFYIFGPDYYVWCIEIHCINYLLHKSNKFTQNAIDSIIDGYIKNNSALFHDNLKKLFADRIDVYLKKFIGKNKNEIIDECLMSYKKWDLYSISILYIKTLTFLFKNNILNNKWIIDLYSILFDNINPDPEMRHTVDETIQLIEDLNNRPDDLKDVINVLNVKY